MEDKEDAEKLPQKHVEKTERGMRARPGGRRQKAAHLQESLLTLFSLVPYQPGPGQSLVKNTNTCKASSCFRLTLASPHSSCAIPDTALPRGFYDCLCKHMSILGCGYFCVSWFELAKQVFVIWVGVTQKAADAWSPVTDPQLGYGDGPHGQSLRFSVRPGTEKGQGTALTRVSQGARAWSKP